MHEFPLSAVSVDAITMRAEGWQARTLREERDGDAGELFVFSHNFHEPATYQSLIERPSGWAAFLKRMAQSGSGLLHRLQKRPGTS